MGLDPFTNCLLAFGTTISDDRCGFGLYPQDFCRVFFSNPKLFIPSTKGLNKIRFDIEEELIDIGLLG